ncbi:hypothetical protein Prudu_832S000100 [Prunus dulcis]|uniref:Uncharacterized protein n=1 Tax=Prunus dulcis TaxID=3755 RepID=A0A5H2Y4G2_PRUDU|nr:hypothetical protein Prudu_832S000100 [Prunus dulcis]
MMLHSAARNRTISCKFPLAVQKVLSKIPRQDYFGKLCILGRVGSSTIVICLRQGKMSESSDRESLDPPAFGGDELRVKSPASIYVLKRRVQRQRGLGVRGLSHPKIPGSAAYREMQRNYIELEAIANRVLALPKSRGGFEQPGITIRTFGSVFRCRGGIRLQSEIGPAAERFCVPAYVGLRLPTEADVVRYPADGSVMIFTDMYRHGFRLPFHPWVQMMLAKLGYAPGQYNPNFWLLLHGVYIAWWLAGLGEPTFEQFMYLYSIRSNREFWLGTGNCRKAKERGYFIGHKPTTQKSWRNRFSEVGPYLQGAEDEVEWVRAQLSETERECGNLVTQKNLFESGLLQGMAGIIRGSTKVAVDIDEAEMQKRLRESGKKAEKSAGKRPRDDDEGRVADVLGKRKALEEAHQHVMGTAEATLRHGGCFAEGVEKVDFGRLRQQKKEVNLAMHRQEVPLVNVFLEGVKSDPEALAKTPASSSLTGPRRRSSPLPMPLARCQEQSGGGAGGHPREERLAGAKGGPGQGGGGAEESKAEEVAAARVEAIESFRSSEELKSYIMDRLVDEQLRWEDRLVRFNPSLEINFDTSGEPPAQTPPADASAPTPEAEPATRMPRRPSPEGVAFVMAEGTFVGIFGSQGNLAHDPVPHFESTGLDSGVVVFGDALFVRDIAHARLVPELVNEVEVECQLLVIGRGVVSGRSVCGLANLYRSHGLGSK